MEVIARFSITVKLTPLLFTSEAVSTTLPEVAPVGTVTATLVLLQLVGVAVVPLKLTKLDSCVAPKFVPVIVTAVPTVPEVTDKLVIEGAGTTVKFTPLVPTPLALTKTFPVVAPDGTTTPMLSAFQLVTVAAVPLKVTVPEPWVKPKFEPVIVTEAPIAPDAGVRALMLGVGRTVKATPLLAVPTVTKTLPVVAPVGTVAVMLDALQLVIVAVVPLNVTVLPP
jgi:hypothetical protein